MRTRNLLPARLREKLADRAKRGNTSVMVRVLYVEIEEEIDAKTKAKRERRVTKPQQLLWGVLGGLHGLDYRPLLRIGKRLSEADSALVGAVADVDQPIASMRKWAAALEYVGVADGELSKHEGLLESFCRPENMRLLWLLIVDRFEQLAVINAALEIASQRRISDDEAAAARKSWAQEVRDAHGGRDFEIVG